MEDISLATDIWLQFFNKNKDQMYTTLSQDDVNTMINYLNAVESVIMDYRRERGDFSW
jgi:hypothetical protein